MKRKEGKRVSRDPVGELVNWQRGTGRYIPFLLLKVKGVGGTERTGFGGAGRRRGGARDTGRRGGGAWKRTGGSCGVSDLLPSSSSQFHFQLFPSH